MSQKMAKLIRKYVKITMYKDLRSEGIVDRPDYVIRQKLSKMNKFDRVNFIQEMKDKVKSDE